MKKLMLSVFAIVAFGFSANAVGVTASADGHVELVVPGTVVPGSNKLEFGQIAIGTTGGTVTMTPTANGDFGTPSTGGDVALLGGTTRTVANFNVTGGTTQTCGIAVPTEALALTKGGVATTVTIAFNTPASTLTLAAGIGTFYVGGTLTIPASAQGGDYTGTFDVTVSYN